MKCRFCQSQITTKCCGTCHFWTPPHNPMEDAGRCSFSLGETVLPSWVHATEARECWWKEGKTCPCYQAAE